MNWVDGHDKFIGQLIEGKKMTKWAIRLFHDEPIWLCDGKEELFDTEQEAIDAMEEECKAIEADIKAGYLEDFDFEDFRIVEVLNAD
jgi:hypothetical protein